MSQSTSYFSVKCYDKGHSEGAECVFNPITKLNLTLSGMGSLRHMAVLRPNEAYLCYF